MRKVTISFIFTALENTWSAAGIVVSRNVNSRKFTLPKANHATARIANMDKSMLDNFVFTIKKMIAVDVSAGTIK